MVKTYDPASYELAVYFLQGEPNLNTEEGRDNLAKTIQTAIEDWFEDMNKITTEEIGHTTLDPTENIS
jgi:hypothetical protein